MNHPTGFHGHPTVRGRARRLVLGLTTIFVMVLGAAGMGAATAAADTVTVGNAPFGVAVTPDGSFAYVTNNVGNSVSVIDTDTVVGAPIPVGTNPLGVAITPDGTRTYVTNTGDNTVSVIDTGTNTVIETVPVGIGPSGVAITPDGTRTYVTNTGDGTVSVIGIDQCTGSLCIDFGSLTGSGSGAGSTGS
ncbi:YncE family protein [Rhodococcus marinonascens]|uniref:YncE family protein n=1 Tax=Rhodococcus marinonascens TaxID=38311 RepID=UPI000A49F973|nr:YncE family protein [Rhodococcus marinonascens]